MHLLKKNPCSAHCLYRLEHAPVETRKTRKVGSSAIIRVPTSTTSWKHIHIVLGTFLILSVYVYLQYIIIYVQAYL